MPTDITTGSGPFRHGVASGDPLTDRVVLWTRVTPPDGTTDPVPVDWVIARDEGLRDVVASGTATATPDGDWTVHAEPTGLEADTYYHYRFSALGGESDVARTRTLPESTDHLRFAFCSCAKFNAGFFNGYSAMAERDDIQFLLHLGDYIYEMANAPKTSTQTPGADIGRPFDPLEECITLDDYRQRYSQYHLDPDVQAFHLRHPIISTCDDHEFADGAWSGGSTEHKPEYGPWDERMKSCFRVREEWLPIRRPDPKDPSRVFRSFTVGDLAEIFITDTRSRRDEPMLEPEMSAPGRSAWGKEQREWLWSSLDASTARWRILGNPSVISPIYRPDFPDDVTPAFLKVKIVAEDGSGADSDQWDGYPDERDAFFRHIIEEGWDNLVVLSGDVHISIVAELSRKPFGDDDTPFAVEFVTPSLTSQNLDDKMKWERHSPEARAIEKRALEFLPHWKFLDLDSHGYTVVDVTRDQVVVDYVHLDTVLERSTKTEHAASFAVKHGEPKVKQLK